jgi:glycosyltransferase involved in cell wall biosynthesis
MQNIYNVQRWNGITIYPMNSVSNATTGGEFYISEMQQFIANLKDSVADVLIIVYPTYDNVVVSNRLHEVLKNTIWYYPVDGANISEGAFRELGKVSKVIPMTKDGGRELEKGKLGNVTKEIYHGFDEKVFYKINKNDANEKKQEHHYCKWSTDKHQLTQDPKVLCKRGCFRCTGTVVGCEYIEEEKITANLRGEIYKGVVGNLELLKDQFGVECIFGFTGENASKRKKIDRLLNSYASLIKSDKSYRNETMLLMHTMPYSNNGLNLWDYIKKYNLIDANILFVYGEDELGNSWSDRALNVMYNSIDVNVSASGSEGFGLPTMESMAVGKPQIAPRFSSFIELVGEDRGLLADISGYETLDNGLKRALVSSKSMGDLMGMMISDGSLIEKMGNNAYDWSRAYTWSNICNGFNDVIKSFV